MISESVRISDKLKFLSRLCRDSEQGCSTVTEYYYYYYYYYYGSPGPGPAPGGLPVTLSRQVGDSLGVPGSAAGFKLQHDIVTVPWSRALRPRLGALHRPAP